MTAGASGYCLYFPSSHCQSPLLFATGASVKIAGDSVGSVQAGQPRRCVDQPCARKQRPMATQFAGLVRLALLAWPTGKSSTQQMRGETTKAAEEDFPENQPSSGGPRSSANRRHFLPLPKRERGWWQKRPAALRLLPARQPTGRSGDADARGGGEGGCGAQLQSCAPSEGNLKTQNWRNIEESCQYCWLWRCATVCG